MVRIVCAVQTRLFFSSSPSKRGLFVSAQIYYSLRWLYADLVTSPIYYSPIFSTEELVVTNFFSTRLFTFVYCVEKKIKIPTIKPISI